MISSRRNLFKRTLAATGAIIVSSPVIAQVVTEQLPLDIHRMILQHYAVDKGIIPQTIFDTFDLETQSASDLFLAHKKEEQRKFRELKPSTQNGNYWINTTETSGHVLQFHSDNGWVSVQDMIDDIDTEDKPSEVIAYEAKLYTQYDTTRVDQFLEDYNQLVA